MERSTGMAAIPETQSTAISAPPIAAEWPSLAPPSISAASVLPSSSIPSDPPRCVFPNCGMWVSSPDADALVSHYQQHLETHGHPFCPACFQRIESGRDIVDHFLSFHAHLTKHSCQFCDRRFWMRRTLHSHVNNAHANRTRDVKLK